MATMVSSFRRRTRAIAVLIVALVVLYLLFGFLLAPRIIRVALNNAFDAALTRRPTLAQVRVNPFTTSVTLRGFALHDSSSQLVVGFDELSLRANLPASLFGTWTLSRVNLVRPRARLEILPDGSLNVARLLKTQPPPPPSTSRKGPTFAIGRLNILEGGLEFLDGTRTPPFRQELRPITFELTGFSTRRDSRNGYSLVAGTDRAERLAWNGTFSLEPFRSTGSLRLDRIKAVTVDRLMTGLLPFRFTRGELDVSADYAVDGSATPAEFGLSAMALSARGIALADTADGTEWIEFAEATLKDGTADAGRRQIALDELTARGGKVLVYLRPDGHTNFETWVAPPDTAPPWITTVRRMNVVDGTVTFEDRRLPEPARITTASCSLEVTGYSSARDATFRAAATGAPEGGGRVAALGTILPAKPGADLDLEVDGVDLRMLQPYLDVFTGMRLVRGRVDARGKLRFGTLGPRGPLMRYTGTLTSRDFASVDRRHNEALLDWRRLRLQSLTYDLMPQRVTIATVRIDRPFARAVIAGDRTLNLQQVMVPPDSLPPAFRGAPVETVAVRVDSVIVADGTLDFGDLTLRPNFATGIQALHGAIRGLSSTPGSQADVSLDGRVDAYAPARISGTIGPIGLAGSRTDISLSFRHIELTTFTPYSGKFMGYPIERGKLSLDLRYIIEGRSLRGENKILMEQLSLGRKTDSPDATRLPIKFAIALLKDREGNIDLDIPVKGSLDDPQFSLVRIILKVLLRLIVKAVTSPFKLFGALFGGDEESESIEFAPGGSDLAGAEGQRIAAVGKALQDRPELRLDVEEIYDPGLDSLALAEAHYVRRLQSQSTPREGIPDSTARTIAALGPTRYPVLAERLYRTSFGNPPRVESPRLSGLTRAQKDSVALAVAAERLRQMEVRLRTDIRVEQAELQVLARRRAEAIKARLVDSAGVAPERIFIVNRGAGATRGPVELPAWASEPDSAEAASPAASAQAAAPVQAGTPTQGAPPALASPPRSRVRADRVRVRITLDG